MKQKTKFNPLMISVSVFLASVSMSQATDLTMGEMQVDKENLAKQFGVPTLLHTCGSSSWAYEDYIEMGLTGVDTLQPEAANMSPAHLKKTFGGRLVFHGCISSTGALSFGSPDDVEADCCQTLETMMTGGGYAFSPTHCLQDNTPTENVIRMYETVHQHGWY